MLELKKLAIAMAMTTPLFLTACGGGGGGSSPSPTPTPAPTPAPAPTPTPTPVLTAQTISPFTIPGIGVSAYANLNATASSGLAVTYTSTTPTVCSVYGNRVRGESSGTCNIIANQAGNTTFAAAPSVTGSVVVGAQSINLSIPALMVDSIYPVFATATSALPVSLTSSTPSICTVSGMVVAVVSTVPGSCTITATQSGSGQFSPAPSVTVTAAVSAASPVLAAGTVPVPTSFPQAGSMRTDSATTFEGVYYNPQGGIGYVDSSNGITYSDGDSFLFGLLQISGLTWTLSPSSIYYSNLIANNITATPAMGSGNFVTKQSLVATTQSFATNPSPLNLTYSPSNSYAFKPADLAGTWMANSGTEQMQMSIDSAGMITGSFSDTSGGRCVISGKVASADANTSHNLFNVSFQGTVSNDWVGSCHLDSSVFQGLSTVRFFAATSNSVNGLLPVLNMITRTIHGTRLSFNLYKKV